MDAATRIDVNDHPLAPRADGGATVAGPVSTASTASTASTEADKAGVPRSVLVVDDNTRVPQWFRDHFGTHYHVVAANSVSTAVDAFERHDIAVIATSETVGGESTLALLRLLQEHYPQTVAVVLTATQDSELVVRLINEVKVCRVLFKPVKTGAVELALKAAMKLHEAHRNDPALWQGDAADEDAGAPDQAGVRPSLFDRMRARLRWPTRRGSVAP